MRSNHENRVVLLPQNPGSLALLFSCQRVWGQHAIIPKEIDFVSKNGVIY